MFKVENKRFSYLISLSYLHNIWYFPTAFTPLCPPDYFIEDEILSHYPEKRRNFTLAVWVDGRFLNIAESNDFVQREIYYDYKQNAMNKFHKVDV